MKKIRIAALFAALVLLFNSCGADSGTADTKVTEDTELESTVTSLTLPVNGSVMIADMLGLYKTQGRTIADTDSLALLSTADSFEFNAKCKGSVSVTLVGEALDITEEMRGDSPDIEPADVYFTVYVDGVRSEERLNIKEGESELILASELEEGEHNFRLVRQSEWEHGRALVKSVSLAGEILEAPAEKELYIEFIGDSIATGFGNVPEYESEAQWGGNPIWQDGTQAFAYMTAEALDADYSIVAVEGIGAACGYWSFTMNDVYENYPRILEKDYTYQPQRTADIVVIELLSNDGANWREAGLTVQDIIDKGIELTKMAKEKHPDAKIIFSPGVFPKQFEERYREEFGGEENGYYVIDLPMDTAGKAGHPTVAGQQMAADALIPFIEDIIG